MQPVVLMAQAIHKYMTLKKAAQTWCASQWELDAGRLKELTDEFTMPT